MFPHISHYMRAQNDLEGSIGYEKISERKALKAE